MQDTILILETILTYACLLAGSHRPRNATDCFLSVAILSISLLVYPISFVSFSVSLCQVFRGLLLCLFPEGFHVMVRQVMVSGSFLNVCPIHLHFLFYISFSSFVFWKPYERKKPRRRPARRWRDELDDYWKGTIWQRIAQDMQMWKQHAEAFAQPRDTMAAQ